MAKRVSADTITQITSEASFGQGGNPPSPPPSVEDIIEKTRVRLRKEVIAAEAYLDAADPENERTIEQRKKDVVQAQANEKLLDTLLNDVPAGFKLVPAFYSRITQEENNAIREQYSFHVRPRFMKFLGENYADDLRAIGIAEEGIERMKNGLDPEDEKGKKYNLNVDHIIERAGSGMMGKTMSVDADQPGSKPIFNINHFGNFILLPEPVHEYKNMLNDLQVASDMPFEKGKWIIMMVPERNDVHHGFVAQPQPATSKLKGVTTSYPGLSHNQYIVDVLLGELSEMKDTGNMRNVVRGLIAEADKTQQTVAEAAEMDARQKKGGLRATFNAAVKKDKQLDLIVNGLVRHSIKDVTESLTQLFRHVTYDTSDKYKEQAFWDFARFFRSDTVKYLRKDVEALPLQESVEMQRAFKQLDNDLKVVADKLDAAGKARRAEREKQAGNDNNSRPPKKFDNRNKKPFRPQQGRVNKPGAR